MATAHRPRPLASSNPKLNRSSSHGPAHKHSGTTHKSSGSSHKVTEMSPEARRALLMMNSREDLKENVSSTHKISGKTNTLKTPQNSNNKSRLPPRPRDSNVTSQRSGNPQTTARSRSTLSHHEGPRSASSGTTNNLLNNNMTFINKHLGLAGSSMSNNNNSVASLNLVENDEYEQGSNDEVEMLELRGKNTSGGDPEGLGDLGRGKSFVLSLNQALEEHGLSRLRGDITDRVQTNNARVRALDGGRLTNAQEVVVNVCHNDARELVFHDDDEESLDTAAAASFIRVNVWMDYNDNFPHDDGDTDEEDDNGDDNAKTTNVADTTTTSSKSTQFKNKNNKNERTSRAFLQPRKDGIPTPRGPPQRLPTIHISSNNNNNLNERTKSRVASASRPTSASPVPLRKGSGVSSDNSSRKNSKVVSEHIRKTSASSKQRKPLPSIPRI